MKGPIISRLASRRLRIQGLPARLIKHLKWRTLGKLRRVVWRGVPSPMLVFALNFLQRAIPVQDSDLIIPYRNRFMRIRGNEHIGRMLLFGSYRPKTEWVLSEFARARFRHKKIINCLDVGANVGNCSLILADLYGEATGRIIALEPHLESYGLLCENVELNSLSHLVEPRCVGLAEATGVRKFYSSEVGVNRSNSQLASGEEFDDLGTVDQTSISCVNLLSLVPKEGLDFIRLDMQGFEISIIADLDKIPHKPVISISVNPGVQLSGAGSAFLVLTEMARLGYLLFAVVSNFGDFVLEKVEPDEDALWRIYGREQAELEIVALPARK